MATVVTTNSHNNTGAEAKEMPSVVVIDKFPFSGIVYSEQALARLAGRANIVAMGIDAIQFRQRIEQFSNVKAILSTWGMPPLDSALLDALPALQAVFYAAGEHSALYLAPAVQRGITFCSAIAVNSHYVAFQSFASTVLALKQALQLRDAIREGACWDLQLPNQGIYRKRIGLVAFGKVGRMYAQMLRELPVDIFVWDPFVDDAALERAGVGRLALADIFSTCDVISVHLPLNSETRGIIDAPLLEQMKLGSTFINTARGDIIDEAALVRVLRERPDITAILDVCITEPPRADDPLYQLKNCYLTPHISGAIGSEREHLGDCMVDEALRWISGQPLLHQIPQSSIALLSPH